jgi:hypothetical protein
MAETAITFRVIPVARPRDLGVIGGLHVYDDLSFDPLTEAENNITCT